MQTSLLVTAKTAFVVLLMVAVFHLWLGFTINQLLCALPLILLLVVGAGPDAIDGSIALAFAMSTVLLLPAYAVKQFIFGFPDRNRFPLVPEVVPKPAGVRNREAVAEACDGEIGSVVSTLRPQGTVSVNGLEFPAASQSGTFIESGAAIRVCGRRNALLLVQQIDGEHASPTDD